MENTTEKIKRIKVDALYGKKKHFNAADRKEKNHLCLGIPLLVINVITSSVLFATLTTDTVTWVKYIPLILTLIATLLGAFQTFFNLQKKIEGHRRVGNKYLAILKRCDRLQGYISDNIISHEDVIKHLEEISQVIDTVNVEAESYPTSDKDYLLAKKGIESGEETYTETELNI